MVKTGLGLVPAFLRAERHRGRKGTDGGERPPRYFVKYQKIAPSTFQVTTTNFPFNEFFSILFASLEILTIVF